MTEHEHDPRDQSFAEGLDADGGPLGAPLPLTDGTAIVDDLTARSIAHNVSYATPDGDAERAAASALRLARALTPQTPREAAREGLRLWVALYHQGDDTLAAAAAAALARLDP